MAFRKPEERGSSPSLGYRLSSNRQPGVEIANNMMPSRPMPRFSPEDMPFPNPGQGRPAPMPRPMPMPMPGPMEPFRPPPGMNPFSPEDLMPRERQGIEQLMPYREMAELSEPQLNFMNSPMGTPDFYSNYQDYKDAVDAREDKGFLGIFGGQKPATDPEIINYLRERYGTIPFQVPGIV